MQRNYEVGVEKSAGPGEDIFSVRTGHRYEASVFVGLIFGWTATDTWEQDIEEHQLMFEGAEGATLKCTYRNSRIPAVPIEINSSRNPSVRSPFSSVAGGTVNNTMRPMSIEVANPEQPSCSYAGVEFEVLEMTPKTIRFRILADQFGVGSDTP